MLARLLQAIVAIQSLQYFPPRAKFKFETDTMSSLKERTEIPAVAAPLTKKEIHRVFYGLMLGGFLSAVNQTIVATALPTIGRHFGDFENLSWVIIAYLLSSTVVSPLYGKLSDIHGRRGMMLVAIGLFIAGSALCAVAPSMAWLIAGRTLQGIGGGGIVPMVQTSVADMVTPRERGHYQAYMGTAWVVAGVMGPALGGIIADKLHWSLIFWLNVPLGLVAALLCSNAMKRLPRHGRSHKLDLLGASLVVAAATHAVAGADHGRHPHPLAVAADPRPGRRLDPAHCRIRLVDAARA